MDPKYEKYVMQPHHVSLRHRAMPAAKRAAQFAPFAALTGYDSALSEEARLTDSMAELSEDRADELGLKLRTITENISAEPRVSVTYFRPDEKKQGGAYITVSDRLKKYDPYEKTFVTRGGEVIPVGMIYDIEMIPSNGFGEESSQA